MEKEITKYNKKNDFLHKVTLYKNDLELYKKDCGESIDEILVRAYRKCVIEGIPIFIAAAVSNDEKGTEYIYHYNGTGSAGINLTEDNFIDFLLVANGLKAKRPGAIYDFNNEEVEKYFAENDGISNDNIEINDEVPINIKSTGKKRTDSNIDDIGEI